MNFALALTLAFGPGPDHATDSWLGADKAKHFFMSAFVQSVGFSGLRAVRVPYRAALTAASTATLAVGVGKEIHDLHAHGIFSRGDLAWDILGAGTATILLAQTPR